MKAFAIGFPDEGRGMVLMSNGRNGANYGPKFYNKPLVVRFPLWPGLTEIFGMVQKAEDVLYKLVRGLSFLLPE
ncbi:MAG: hypothetical protein IAE79_21675 [Anaerolinea sp.]|nr:hypothetical protein [Anaerolinea sp.]